MKLKKPSLPSSSSLLCAVPPCLSQIRIPYRLIPRRLASWTNTAFAFLLGSFLYLKVSAFSIVVVDLKVQRLINPSYYPSMSKLLT